MHVDKKSDIKNKLVVRKNVVILPDELRVDVQWGNISQVDATLNLLEYATEYGDYDFYWLCSGQDFPIKSVSEIVNCLSKRRNSEFIELVPSKNNGLGYENNMDKRNAIFFSNWMLGKDTWKKIVKRAWVEVTGGYSRTFGMFRKKNTTGMNFYFGSCWFCLSKQMVLWMREYLDREGIYNKFFESCNCPDEPFFQTLVMNSPFAENRQEYLHYVDWSCGGNNPKILTVDDYEKIVNSEYLMARKFDIRVDKEIIERFQNRL